MAVVASVVGGIAIKELANDRVRTKTIIVFGPKGAGKSTFAHYFSTGEYPVDLAINTASTPYKHEAPDGTRVLTVDTPGSYAGKDGKRIHSDEWEGRIAKLRDDDLICYVVSSTSLFDAMQLSTVLDDANWLKDHRGKRTIVQVVTHLDIEPLSESQGFAQLIKITGNPIWSGNLLDPPSMETLCKTVLDELYKK